MYYLTRYYCSIGCRHWCTCLPLKQIDTNTFHWLFPPSFTLLKTQSPLLKCLFSANYVQMHQPSQNLPRYVTYMVLGWRLTLFPGCPVKMSGKKLRVQCLLSLENTVIVVPLRDSWLPMVLSQFGNLMEVHYVGCLAISSFAAVGWDDSDWH